MELAPGQVIDRYTVEGLIGEGGMAAVYRVRHSQLGTPHALKVLSMTSRSIRERLLQEGRVQATMRHPNIVAVTDVVDVQGQPGLVMEYIDGPSLDALLESRQLTLEQADKLAEGVLAGVRAAHSHDLIHRDLKPANIMLAQVGNTLVPKVMDFGLAKVVTSNPDDSGRRTRTGSTMGTPSYMSPEQVRDSKNVDLRTDIFALGAILYEMVTNKRAFVGDDLFVIFSAVATGNFVPPRELVPDLPDRMNDAILGALRVEREERVQDVQTLMDIWAGRVALDAEMAAATPRKPAFDEDLLAAAASLSSSASLSPVSASSGASPSSPSGPPQQPTWGPDEPSASAAHEQYQPAGETVVPGATLDGSLEPEPDSSLAPSPAEKTQSTSVSIAPEGAGLAVLGLGGLALAGGALFVALLAVIGVWYAMSQDSGAVPTLDPVEVVDEVESEGPGEEAQEVGEAMDEVARAERRRNREPTPRPRPATEDASPAPTAPSTPVEEEESEAVESEAESEAVEAEDTDAVAVVEPVQPEPEPEPEPEPTPRTRQTDGPVADDGTPIPSALVGGDEETRMETLLPLEDDPGATQVIAWVLANDPDGGVRRKAWRIIRARWRSGTGDFEETQKVVAWVMRAAPRGVRLEAIAEYQARGTRTRLLLPAIQSSDSTVASKAIEALPAVLARDPDGKEEALNALRKRRARETDARLRRQLEDAIRDL